ncbi:peptide MFS transporter [Telmatospirillum sp.]|uniref:peptide MFS transporter n=1 Tax=Telmatospirillum sp. TaxID=2079197 RepID=UPI0028495FB7|nr:peptide MFS transporter [Telmatospirillum sp.]MDR3435963.1 peptide MFS transporter [Telmatospirillum sp.]
MSPSTPLPLTADDVPGLVDHGTVFGHPKALTFLFGTEMWERFSYYGMRALLTLYMVKYLFLNNPAETVFGYSTLKAMLESVFGPLGVQPMASQVYGLYTGLVFLTPILGGLVADRLIGRSRTVVIGAALMAVGHFMMAFEGMFLPALLVLIIGNGAFKPNISTQVGGLYAPGDHRRDRAYSIFYVGINLGAFFSPLVCGTLGETVGWHFGFGAAGVGMLVGLFIYLYGKRYLPPEPPIVRKSANREKTPFTRQEWKAVIALLILWFPNVLFWATYEQQGNTIALWADDFTDRSISLLSWTAEIPTTWFQAFNPFMIFAFTPFVVTLWAWQAKRGSEPSTVTKMAFGCFGVALANLLMVMAAHGIEAGGKSNWLWLFGYFAILTTGELYLSPIGLSLVSKVAPGRILSMMMGVWLATSFAGNFLSGWLGSFWSSMDKAAFFLMIAAIAAGAGVVIWLFNKPLTPILGE